MKLPIKWLNDYVKVDLSPSELAQKLLSIGFEVEEIIYLGAGIENVVAGKIEQLEKHPNADKLQICTVSIGSKTNLQIVTGANNISVGNIVPVALDCAKLPDGKEIRSGELRGVKSEGMLCSGGELNLSNSDFAGAEEHGILVLPKSTKIGEDIRKVIGKDEYVLDISITANRPDCQSIYGISREIAAVLGKKIKPLETDYLSEKSKKIKEMLTVENLATDVCPCYMAGLVTDVAVKPSPKYISDRLKLVGLKPINNYVDITNFILLELGQPMHAFDYEKLGKSTIKVRKAQAGEKIITLDGVEYALGADMLAVCDYSSPSAIAGIMGGQLTKTEECASSIVLESAVFLRESIRKTSKKLGLRSDSSAMFERGVSTYSANLAMDRALHFVAKYEMGKIASGIIVAGNNAAESRKLMAPISKINDVLGIKIKPQTMKKILCDLSIETEIDGDNLKCILPPYRADIDRTADIAEEIIRYYGYDNIVGTMLVGSSVTNGKYSITDKNINNIENELVAFGLNEIITYSFIGNDGYKNLSLSYGNAIKLMNPLSEEMSIMRTQLTHSMLSVVSTNARKGSSEAKLFEIASTYNADKIPLEKLPTENTTLCIGMYGDSEDFYTLKGAVYSALKCFGGQIEIETATLGYMHPYRCAAVKLNGILLGYMGEVHPLVLEKYEIVKRCYVAELNLASVIDLPKNSGAYGDIGRFVGTYRDIALLVGGSVTHGDIERCILQAGGDIVHGVELFDIYRDEKLAEKRSMAYKIRFKSLDKTLSNNDVNPVMDKILLQLESELGVTLRAQ